jgi:3-oxoadipate enol-lactonase/4-carboxymuconolactone decarboxylase
LLTESLVLAVLGGAVGLALARRVPERLERLVLCCTAARFGEPETWVERARTVRADGPEAVVDAALGRWFTRSFHETHADVVARFRAAFVATPREGYAACCEALAAWDFHDELAAIQVPTLVVAAADDPSTPPEQLELIAERIAGARLVRIENAAHLANVERPEEVTALILEHLVPNPERDRHAAGMTVRRAVLGDEHVDRAIERTTPLTAPFQDFITRYAWGDVWTRPGLERRTRSMLTLALLCALRYEGELAMHVRAAIRNGLTPEEIGEVLLHTAVYAGVPAANSAYAVAQRTLSELGLDGAQT